MFNRSASPLSPSRQSPRAAAVHAGAPTTVAFVTRYFETIQRPAGTPHGQDLVAGLVPPAGRAHHVGFDRQSPAALSEIPDLHEPLDPQLLFGPGGVFSSPVEFNRWRAGIPNRNLGAVSFGSVYFDRFDLAHLAPAADAPFEEQSAYLRRFIKDFFPDTPEFHHYAESYGGVDACAARMANEFLLDTTPLADRESDFLVGPYLTLAALEHYWRENEGSGDDAERVQFTRALLKCSVLVDGKLITYPSSLARHALNCRRLLTLPDNLHIVGDFEINDSLLTSAPRGLRVNGNLRVHNAARLTSFAGDDVWVFGDVSFRSCRVLTQLSGSLLSHPLSQPRMRPTCTIEVQYCRDWSAASSQAAWAQLAHERILVEHGNALAEAGADEGMHHGAWYFGHEGFDDLAEPTAAPNPFSDLSSTVAEWGRANNRPEFASRIAAVLARVRQTAEWQNTSTRADLELRVRNIMHFILSVDHVEQRDSLCEMLIAHDTSCEDGAILGWDALEFEMHSYLALHSDTPEESLRQIAKLKCRLDVVMEHALARAAEIKRRVGHADPVEYYLKYTTQINQRHPGFLPCSTTAMNYSADVQAGHISAAMIVATAAADNLDNFEMFLSKWNVWQQYQRRLISERTPWESIAEVSSKTEHCAILEQAALQAHGAPTIGELYDGFLFTQLKDISDPVCLNHAPSVFFSYREFLQQKWIRSGQDHSNADLSLADLRRF